jgi:Tol biopolymer transport system component
MKNGFWDSPANIPFSMEYINDEPALSPDGKKLYFVSTRPESGEAEAQKLPDIWVVERTDEGWGVPHILGAPVNTEGIEVQPFCSTDDKLYFGRYDGLYYSQFINGQFSDPVRLNENIFKGRVRGICISPDNNTLVVHSDKPGGSGSWDLYASFRDPAGKWTELVNMGKAVNTDLSESNATFSPDGKYLFFSRDDDIYWISAGIFEKIKTN